MGKQAGAKIRKMRQETGIFQSELAKRSDVSESAIRSYELGDRNAKDGHRESIAAALNCSPEFLIDYEVEHSNQIMHHFMQLEEASAVEPAVSGDEVYLRVTRPELVAGIKEWSSQRKTLEIGEISEDDYWYWKARFDVQKGR